MPDHDHPPVDSLAYSRDLNVFRSKAEMLAVIANLKESLAWYVEERNRLIQELDAFKREQQARLDMKKHHERDYPE
jgi:hypothetical protein